MFRSGDKFTRVLRYPYIYGKYYFVMHLKLWSDKQCRPDQTASQGQFDLNQQNLWRHVSLNNYGKYPKISYTKVSDKMAYVNSADPDQTAPKEQSDHGLQHLPFHCKFGQKSMEWSVRNFKTFTIVSMVTFKSIFLAARFQTIPHSLVKIFSSFTFLSYKVALYSAKDELRQKVQTSQFPGNLSSDVEFAIQ